MNIQIKAGRTKADTKIKLSGEIEEIISDKERETFKIQNKQLKDAVHKYHGGVPPCDVFVKSPTPWGDAYRTYNWEQVKRTLEPVASRVIGIRTKPVIIATQEFENYSSRVKAKFTGAIAHEVEETLDTTWSVGGALTVGQEITYSLNFGVGAGASNIGSNTSWQVTCNWNKNTSKTKKVGLGVTTGVEVELEPRDAAQAVLTASHGTMDIEIDYEASLSGYVFANYSYRHEGHRFWAIPVEWVLDAADLPKCVKSTEKLSIGFYSNARVEVRDLVGERRDQVSSN